MIDSLDNFVQERKSIQEKFNKILENGLSDEFMEYYEVHLRDERYSIDQHSFEVNGSTDSSNITPRLRQVIQNGKISLILDEGRCDFKFFLKDTTIRVPDDRKWKWGGYFYVYRYIAQFCELELDECIYLYEFSKLRKGAFFFYGITDDQQNNMPFLLSQNKHVSELTLKGLKVYIELNDRDTKEA